MLPFPGALLAGDGPFVGANCPVSFERLIVCFLAVFIYRCLGFGLVDLDGLAFLER